MHMVFSCRRVLQLRDYEDAILFRRSVYPGVLDAGDSDRGSCQRTQLLGSKGDQQLYLSLLHKIN
jgi:hypothetical protein